MSIYHKHHIIPKHMGGSDDPSNLIELTIEEHAEAHRKLFEQYGHWQDEVAWKGLAGIIPHAESVRESQSKPNKGRPLTEEHKKKMSNAHKGVKLSEHHRKRISDAAKNKSAEHRKKISESLKLRAKLLKSGSP